MLYSHLLLACFCNYKQIYEQGLEPVPVYQGAENKLVEHLRRELGDIHYQPKEQDEQVL